MPTYTGKDGVTRQVSADELDALVRRDNLASMGKSQQSSQVTNQLKDMAYNSYNGNYTGRGLANYSDNGSLVSNKNTGTTKTLDDQNVYRTVDGDVPRAYAFAAKDGTGRAFSNFQNRNYDWQRGTQMDLNSLIQSYASALSSSKNGQIYGYGGDNNTGYARYFGSRVNLALPGVNNAWTNGKLGSIDGSYNVDYNGGEPTSDFNHHLSELYSTSELIRSGVLKRNEFGDIVFADSGKPLNSGSYQPITSTVSQPQSYAPTESNAPTERREYTPSAPNTPTQPTMPSYQEPSYNYNFNSLPGPTPTSTFTPIQMVDDSVQRKIKEYAAAILAGGNPSWR